MWCVEALRGSSGGAAGARLELGAALAALRTLRPPAAPSARQAFTRLKAVARANPQDRVLRAEANTDAAFVAYAVVYCLLCSNVKRLSGLSLRCWNIYIALDDMRYMCTAHTI